jgi:formylglycine-generating enzyme required for sulfatase activity
MRRSTWILVALVGLGVGAVPPSEAGTGTSTTRTDPPPGMTFIPAGPFVRGSNLYPDEKPIATVVLDAFWIDTREVTVAQYDACIEAGACTPTPVGRYYNRDRPERAAHPINGVTWHQANAFCRWSGGRLPTEAQWEKAARGTDGRLYPWGLDEPSCARAVMDQKGVNGCGRRTTWPSGSKLAGQSPYGVLGMAGNVYEWTADWYAEDAYQTGPRRNPLGPEAGDKRVLRGGSWLTRPAGMRSTYRLSARPDFVLSAVGVRCAR